MAAFRNAIDTLRRDGFVVVDSFFDLQQVKKAHEEILDLRRQIDAAPDPQVTIGRLGRSTEILSNLYGTCPTLDLLVEQLLTHPDSRALIERVGGVNVKNRDYTCRIMTGEPDENSLYNPPLEWHRDSNGEFVIGIYLTDIPAGDNSATSFVPGSYRFPYDPRWNTLFGRPFYLGNSRFLRKIGAIYGFSFFFLLNPFSRILGRRIAEKSTGAFGKVGDFYLFINQTWHGRLPNRHGLKAAVVQLGFFPTEFPFPNVSEPVREENFKKLPPEIRRFLDAGRPHNEKGKALMYEVLSSTRKAEMFSLFWWVKLERKMAQLISSVLVLPIMLPYRLARTWARMLLRR